MLRPLLFLILTVAHAASLDQEVSAAAAGFGGTVFIFAKNLDTGATFARRPDDRVRAASTIKLPILCAAFQAVAEGRLQWTGLITLHDADKVSGSGVLSEFSDGMKIPLIDLANLMIVVSDNTAANLVLDRVTGNYVNEQMDKLGLKGTRSLRKILKPGADSKTGGFSKAGLDPANQKYGLGSSTPREMVMLLERIEKGQVVSPEASREILKILKRQRDVSGIPRLLGDHVVVANKFGALDHLRSDVGIVYAKGNRIAMAITCDDIPKIDWTADNEGLILISKIAEILVRELK
jgi:beta-lactamase class A